LTSVCDNTFRALELIRSAKIDVVATDISMPEMSGLDLVKWIRMIDKNIPIVAVTAQVAEHVRIEAYKNGINYFIKKPYSESDIREVFLQFLTTK
jgi:CheY-like chemotaxis protein